MNKAPSEIAPNQAGTNTGQGQAKARTQPAPIPVTDDIVVSIIIVTYERMDLLERCLQAIRQSELSVPYEVIVVDNGSKSWDCERVHRACPAARILVNSQNTFYAHANNQGMEIARGKYFLLLNSDAFLDTNSVEAMVEQMERFPGVAVVGPRLIFPDGRTQSKGYRFRRISDALLDLLMVRTLVPKVLQKKIADKREWDDRTAREVDYVLGACWLLRAAVVRQIGPLCEDFIFYSEEGEWCYRAKKAGYSVWYVPATPVVHIWGGSTKESLGDVGIRSRVLLWEKTSGKVYGFVYGALAVLRLLRRMSGTVVGRDKKGERGTIRREMLFEWNILKRLIL